MVLSFKSFKLFFCISVNFFAVQLYNFENDIDVKKTIKRPIKCEIKANLNKN